MGYLYLFITILSFYLVKIRDPNYSRSLSPTLLLLLMMLLYTVFGFLYILEKTDSSQIIFNFWIIQLLCLIGVLFAILFSKFSKLVPLNRSRPNLKVKLIFVILIIAHFFIYINKYGGLISILSTGYKLVFESDDNNLINFSILGLLSSFSLKYKMHKLVFIASSLFFIVAILLGTRGIAIAFISVPFMSFYLDNKRFSYFRLIYFIPGLIFFLIVAYIRNIGFSNFGILFSLDSEFYYKLFIENSEFITTGLVFYTGETNPNWYSINIFEYFYGIVCSLIPKSIWATRPDAISNIFSSKFAPPGEGIGFSIGYESFVILGFLGPMVYFYLIQTLLQKLYSSKTFYINALILFSPLLIMWVNRIDFQTIFKVSLIYLFYCYLWKFVIKAIK